MLTTKTRTRARTRTHLSLAGRALRVLAALAEPASVPAGPGGSVLAGPQPLVAAVLPLRSANAAAQ